MGGIILFIEPTSTGERDQLPSSSFKSSVKLEFLRDIGPVKDITLSLLIMMSTTQCLSCYLRSASTSDSNGKSSVAKTFAFYVFANCSLLYNAWL